MSEARNHAFFHPNLRDRRAQPDPQLMSDSKALEYKSELTLNRGENFAEIAAEIATVAPEVKLMEAKSRESIAWNACFDNCSYDGCCVQYCSYIWEKHNAFMEMSSADRRLNTLERLATATIGGWLSFPLTGAVTLPFCVTSPPASLALSATQYHVLLATPCISCCILSTLDTLTMCYHFKSAQYKQTIIKKTEEEKKKITASRPLIEKYKQDAAAKRGLADASHLIITPLHGIIFQYCREPLAKEPKQEKMQESKHPSPAR